MPSVVQFNGPRDVALVPCPPMDLPPGGVRVATLYSGISAGTELTAYRGTNPYLTGTWDAERRLFVPGSPTFAYPVAGWGYSEVGRVVERAPDAGDSPPAVGDVVYGMWGHRSDAVVPAETVTGRLLPPGIDPRLGTFARVGAIALNAVLAADIRLGDRVAVFGQGVLGLLATRLAVLAGAEVVAVDAHDARLEVARRMGAAEVVRADVPGGAGAAVRTLGEVGGMDAAIELSGAVPALHEAIRSVVVEGTVVASGFYQGGAGALRLGEEFHHNRVRLVASQIGGTPVALGPRWNPERLVRVFMRRLLTGDVDVRPLLTHELPASDVAAAFERLDRGDADCLQVLLTFPAAT